MFLQLFANGLVTGAVFAIAAVGVSLVYGILRLVNFAYGDLMAFGALVAYGCNGPWGLGMVPSALIAMAATAALTVALDLVLWRPLRARRAGFMIAPAVARILADAILEGRRDEALSVLDVARFAENRLVPEPQLV